MKSLFGFRERPITEHHIVLVVGLRARPNLDKEVRELLIGMREPTRAESGCLRFDLHQSKVDTGLFFVYQIWQDEAALEAHMQCAHTLKFRDSAPKLLEEPVLLNKWGLVV